jgi:hypothetical protein
MKNNFTILRYKTMRKTNLNYIVKGLFVLFLGVNGMFGQAPSQNNYVPKLIPPSPNAASLGKYGDIPVSFYTGVPNISIPIYNINERGLGHQISVSYHASGIKVSEEAGRVGLGWALNAGGAISRTIVGEDDFESSKYFGLNSTINAELPRGDDYTPTQLIQISSNYYANFTGAVGQTVDLQNPIRNNVSPEFEPDMYNFNIGGVSGKFVITRERQIILQKNEKLKIEMIEGPSVGNYGDNIKFKITTSNGTGYYFDVLETSVDGNSKFHVNSWYLKKIKSVTGDEITYNYTSVPNTRVYSQGAISETKVDATLPGPCGGGTFTGDPPQPIATSVFPNRSLSINYSLQYLSEIVFSNGKVVFTYNDEVTDKRLDVDGDKKLNAIAIFKNDAASTYTKIKEFTFNYSYFDGGQDADFPVAGNGSLSKRLKLLSITEKAGTQTLPAHEFSYYEGSNFTTLPAKTSFAIDHWGYYNGKQGNTSLVPTYEIFPASDQLIYYFGVPVGIERETDPMYVTGFSLSKIKYPTGGTSEFIYEANDYDIVNSQTKDNSFMGQNGLLDVVKKKDTPFYPASSVGQVKEFDIDLTAAIVQSGGTTTKLKINTFSRFSNFQKPCSTLTQTFTGQNYFELVNLANNAVIRIDLTTSSLCPVGQTLGCIKTGCDPSNLGSGFSQPGLEYNNEITLVPAKYKLRLFVASNNNYGIQDMTSKFEYYVKKSNEYASRGYSGGLRIKTINHFDGVKNEVSNYKYELIDLNTVKKSSGIRMAAPQYSFWEKIARVYAGGVASSNCYDEIAVLRRTSNTIFPLNASASGSVVGYSIVTVEKGINKDQGKTVYYFDNQPDAVSNYGFYRTPQNASIPYEFNGNLMTEETYNNLTQKVKEVKNTYSYNAINPKKTIIWGLEKRNHQRPTAGILRDEYDDFFFYPSIISTFSYLKEKVERVFDPNDLANSAKNFEIKESYVYDETTHLQMKEKTITTSTILADATQQRKKTIYKYPSDFVVAGNAYEGMISQFNYSTVITEQMNVETINASNVKSFNQIFFKNTSYKKWLTARTINTVAYPDLYQPEKVTTQLKITDPITEEITFNSYDTYGNLLQYKERNGLTSTLSYYGSTDYGKVYLVKTQTNNIGHLTTYDYLPLVGVSTIKDPNDRTSTFTYDLFWRLSNIKDNNQNIVKSYQYNFKNQ